MIFSPVKIGNLELSNRLLVPAMGTHLPEKNGTVGDAMVEYWAARAKGGWGLLIVEIAAVDPGGIGGSRSLGLWDDSFIPGLSRLTDVAHRYGTKMAIQLHHAGRQTMSIFTGVQPVGPSPIPCPMMREMPRELVAEEIWGLVKKFGDAAARAREAGFDAVEIHGGHGYLVAEFMSSYSNKRSDLFGGSLTNRMRFPVEIVRDIRFKAGSDYPILFRFSGDEMVPGGRTIPESRAVARILQGAGVNALDVSSGVYGSMYYIQGPAAMPPGYNLTATAEIKKSVSIPVIAVGALHDPFMAEDVLETGTADLIGWGRQSLADPEAPNKLAAGLLEDIRPCSRCAQGCSDRVFKGKTISCAINPFTGRETEWKVESTLRKKQVVVVGGGPGGLECAWLAASRGHQVTLYERGKVLGGQLRIGAIPPFKQDYSRTIAYLVHMCEKHGVTIHLQTEATLERILAGKPDAVILATGAQSMIPEIKGVTGPKVVQAWEVLEGTKPVGLKVLIVGGGLIGAETADFLGEHGHQVTIVEMLPKIALDEEPSTRHFLLDRLRNYRVRMETEVVVEGFLEDGVLGKRNGQEVQLTGFETIILAMGARSVNDLQSELQGKVPELYVIGDAVKPRKALDAIEEGAHLALQL